MFLCTCDGATSPWSIQGGDKTRLWGHHAAKGTTPKFFVTHSMQHALPQYLLHRAAEPPRMPGEYFGGVATAVFLFILFQYILPNGNGKSLRLWQETFVAGESSPEAAGILQRP